jgi:hydrogenase maturation protein HypF
MKLPFSVKRPILACGADLKGAFAFAEGKDVFLADGFGDLGDLDNFTKYEKSVKTQINKLGIQPRIIACDLHPDYFSTRFAESLQLKDYSLKLCRVQHHEAHIASAIVDNNIKADCVGVAFDGTGYGSDGNIWGGEFFIGGLKGFKRAAHLEYVPMPGGDRATKEPWRMAASCLYNAFGDRLPQLAKRWSSKDLVVLKMMMDKKINSPLTSSAGRLFDGAASLILSRDRVTREAELPIELEKLSAVNGRGKYDFDIEKNGEELIIKTSSVIKGIVKDAVKKTDKKVISCRFHNTMAGIVVEMSVRLGKKFKIDQVVLSGGVFQNKYLAAKASEALRAKGLKVYLHNDIPSNDSGIPIGQAAIASTRLRCA